MIEEDKITQAAYAIFLTQMAQQRIPGPDTNQSINEFWQQEWERSADDYRAQARNAFAAAGLSPLLPPG
jgi:hypothetical protein